MTAPFTPPSGSYEQGVVPPTAPCSPFDAAGLCRHCRGFGEHTSGCIYARNWEKFGGGL